MKKKDGYVKIMGKAMTVTVIAFFNFVRKICGNLYVLSLYVDLAFNKIYVSCESGNYILAFLSAVCLQRDLDDEAGCSFDLLGDFDYLHLDRLAEKTHKIENKFIQLIEKNGGRIKKIESARQFEMAH